ncbi:MAG: ABC transporter substrate-binding protein [Burkholderiales bacterium]|nr:MAG: ABC transporter substrate-binding protein [Burkholderiales bacterium]
MVAVSGPAAAQSTMRIGVSGPFTGGSSPMGLSMRNGIRLAVEELNAAGGLLGRRIELVERDDQASNELGFKVAQDLVKREGVIATVGIVNTGVALASQKVYQEARIPVINAVATGSIITRQFRPPEHPDNYVFRVSASDLIQSAMIVREVVERMQKTRIAILADSTNYGQLGRQDVERALNSRGLVPVVVEKYNIRDMDLLPQLQRARAANAEVVVTYGIGPELAAIANGMAKLGWRVPVVGSWTLAMENFIDRAGPNGNGARMPQTFIQEASSAKRRAFIAAYQKQYKVERIPSAVSAAQGYDGMLLLAAAIRQANSTEGPRIREALEDLRDAVDGVIARYERPWTREDHEAIKPSMVVMGEVRDGRVVRAGP